MFVSHKSRHLSFSTPMRSALNLSCRALSSPETYRVSISLSLSMVCRTRVDFPIPGSPPSNTTDAGTSPPPRTRLSSSSIISIRCSSPALISLRGSGLLFISVKERVSSFCDAASLRTNSSTKVDHSPHARHLPIHFGDS